MIIEEIQKLFPDVELQEDSVLKLKVLLEKRLDEERAKIKEEEEAKYNELKEQADAYSEQAKAEIETLREQIEAYSQYVQDEVKALKEQADAYGEYVKEEAVKELAEQVEQYAQYVVEEFVEQNKQSLVEHTEYVRLKQAFGAITNVLAEQNVVFQPEDGIEKLQAELDEHKAETAKILKKLTEANNQLTEMRREKLFESATAELTDTQRERVQALLEGMTFKSDDDYGKSVKMVIGEIAKQKVITETVEPEKKATPADELMQKYLAKL